MYNGWGKNMRHHFQLLQKQHSLHEEKKKISQLHRLTCSCCPCSSMSHEYWNYFQSVPSSTFNSIVTPLKGHQEPVAWHTVRYGFMHYHWLRNKQYHF
ncbi:hypothetical protein CEXT_583681 [Caerostris extrusa]|uniref:Uncharacterized protein n=1 Tax=Caerostris extrusa TaxID=172846 RepID=A0AAV4SQL5_CAEEX|nr:hypothetical protein CEXT_583681 [Caerostris extrusa]